MFGWKSFAIISDIHAIYDLLAIIVPIMTILMFLVTIEFQRVKTESVSDF